MRKLAEKIFLAGVDSVLPDKLIRAQMILSDDVLTICGESYDLRNINHIYVIGAGKAAALMALETERVLGNRIRAGHVVTKYDHGCALQYIGLTEAAHPVPDENGVKATEKITAIARRAKENDLVICLISGGASALLADTPEGISLEDLRITNELLVKSGATIREINIIRKHLSDIKGGQLARLIHPANCVSLILSDVVGDPVDIIASGPTAPDASEYSDAYAIVRKYKLDKTLPETVTKHLLLGSAGVIPETPDAFHPCFQTTRNRLLGSNKIALEACAQVAVQNGFDTHIITDSLQEDYTRVAGFILENIENFLLIRTTAQPLCLLFGGEPTVKVNGNGLGGRNQHLALYLATKLADKPGSTILCAGTDGSDGPTDAAGAVVDNTTFEISKSKGIDTFQYLEQSDSYHFFQQVGGHIRTGSTQTNVMDIIIILIN
ncbi:MAG: glycerate kinase [Paludibacter sp.]|nr:glycerate kinase [Paludibacter sp.]